MVVHASGMLARLALLAVVLATSLSAADATPPLVAAVKRGDHQAVRVLLRAHAKDRKEVNRAEPDGTTALHWAVQADDRELITALVRAGANVNAANRYGIRPLTLAATNVTPHAEGPVARPAARRARRAIMPLFILRGFSLLCSCSCSVRCSTFDVRALALRARNRT